MKYQETAVTLYVNNPCSDCSAGRQGKWPECITGITVMDTDILKRMGAAVMAAMAVEAMPKKGYWPFCVKENPSASAI